MAALTAIGLTYPHCRFVITTRFRCILLAEWIGYQSLFLLLLTKRNPIAIKSIAWQDAKTKIVAFYLINCCSLLAFVWMILRFFFLITVVSTQSKSVSWIIFLFVELLSDVSKRNMWWNIPSPEVHLLAFKISLLFFLKNTLIWQLYV